VDTSRLQSYLVDRAARDLFSGAVRVSREGTTLFEEAYGLASRAWGVPNSIDTRFDTASITKLFTAVVALQVVEEGALSLDTKAAGYLGLEGTSIHPDAELRHLITHTSGIGDDADEEAGEDYSEVWRHHTSYLVREVEDMLPLFIDRPGNFAPGQGCRYCNVAFDLAGLMVERATGEPYRQRVQTHVFDRAGMTESGFFSMDVVEPRVAEGADLVEGRWVRNIYSYMPVGTPSGGAHSTVADLDRFLTAVLDGELLGEEMTTLFLTPQAKHSEGDGEALHMGYGLEFTFDLEGSLLFYEKEGINAGTSAVLRHYPSNGTTLTLLSNMEDGVWEPRAMIDSMLREAS
jgi:CubicO group peptidase (beta-lactamase class C family)